MARIILKLLVLTCSLAFGVAAWAGDVFWIDVRTAEEFAAGHVSGAVNIPYEEITARITEVSGDHDAEIYLYCRSGRRADIAKAALEEMGYTQIVNLRTVAAARDKAAQLSQD
jgi:phage shock operon rhodanese PspE